MAVNCCIDSVGTQIVSNKTCLNYSAACGEGPVTIFEAQDFFPSGVVTITSLTDCGSGVDITITRQDSSVINTTIVSPGSSISTTVNNIAMVQITCNAGVVGNGCTGKLCIDANSVFLG